MRMDERRFRQTLRRAFWVPFGIAVVLTTLLILEVRFLTDRAAWVEHTDQVITVSQRIYGNRTDQESDLRAYVLTGDERFLERLYEGRSRELAMEPELQRLVSDNPGQTKRNKEAFQAFQAWSSWADRIIALTKYGEDTGDPKFQLPGKELMDEYRRVRTEFIAREQQLRDERVASSRRSLEFVNASIPALVILLAIGFAIMGRKQLTSLSASFTKALKRAETNAAEAQSQRDWLHTTLTSIGDAVIATDAGGRVTLMNPVAEKLTEWPLKEAQGKPLGEIFHIVNEQTNEAVENPVEKVRRLNGVVGLANHTILISKSGQRLAIDDSGAPIFGTDGSLAGVVLVFRDVTRQRALDVALQSSAAEVKSQKDRLAGIIGSAMDAIISVDEAQRIQVFNRAAEQIFRCSAADAIGQPLDKFIPDRFREAHRQHIEGFGRTGVTNRSMSRPGNLWARRSDGQEFPIEATISQVECGGQKLFTVVLRDVTERIEAHTKLAEQAGLLELASDAIIVRDESDRISYWNRGAEVLYGWAREEAIGKVAHDLLQTRFPQPLVDIEDRIQQQNHWEGELEHACKNGARVNVLSRWVLVLPGQGKSRRSLMEINTDITRRKQLEAALQSNERLALAGRLSASIAHEIHNPLDTVGNVLFILRQQIEGPRRIQQLIETAQDEVQRVVEISKNMLSLHRESRRPSHFNVAELLEGVVALVEETLAKGRRNIQLEHGFEGEMAGFPAELRQVFTNVLKNAIEATADGGSIRICSVATEHAGRKGVLLTIIDDGIGIPEQMQSKLFSPFATTKEENGSGLGLWVSRNIVEKKHGGTIRISSSASGAHETTVSIFLPLEAIAQTTDEAATAAAHGTAS